MAFEPADPQSGILQSSDHSSDDQVSDDRVHGARIGAARGGSSSVIDVRRADRRFATDVAWLRSRHCFSFGPHYDPANTGFGRLVVSNDDVVAPGSGFDTHPHRDMEIVTWVLSGSLVHQDSQGHNGVIYPGLAQRMTAGRGILHSEKNDSWTLTGDPVHQTPVHFIQMWVLPDEAGVDPGYEQLDINSELDNGGLVVVASGLAHHRDQRAIRIGSASAGLSAGRLKSHEAVALPSAPKVHMFVARGSVEVETGIALAEGDSARFTDMEGLRITAGPLGAEILVWEMY